MIWVSQELAIAGSLSMPYRNYRSFVQHNAAISVLEANHDERIWVHINQTAHLNEMRRE